MTGPGRRSPLVALVLVALVAAVAGCSGSSTEPSFTPSTDASGSSSGGVDTPDGGDTPDLGPLYGRPERMCDVVDVTALKDLYPQEEPEEQHLLNSQRGCDTAVIAGPGRVLGLSVEVRFVDAEAYQRVPTLPHTYYEQRRQEASAPTDIDGVGSAAFWHGNEHEVTLNAHHGNVLIEIWAYAVNGTHALAPDMPQRLVQVAAATLAALPQ